MLRIIAIEFREFCKFNDKFWANQFGLAIFAGYKQIYMKQIYKSPSLKEKTVTLRQQILTGSQLGSTSNEKVLTDTENDASNFFNW